MRITGTLHSIGHHNLAVDYPAKHDSDLEIVGFNGLLITANDDTLRAASNLLYATVDIYPHQPKGVHDLPCTPENFAHCLARLAHAEDHLAREVRSSQALGDSLVKSWKTEDARDAAWSEYLNLRKQLRATADDATKNDLAKRISDISRAHDFDPPTRALEAEQAKVAALEARIAEMENETRAAVFTAQTAVLAAQGIGVDDGEDSND